MSNKINHCEKCNGEGWLWAWGLDGYYDCDDVTRYTCDLCCGEEDPDMVRDRELAAFDPAI